MVRLITTENFFYDVDMFNGLLTDIDKIDIKVYLESNGLNGVFISKKEGMEYYKTLGEI